MTPEAAARKASGEATGTPVTARIWGVAIVPLALLAALIFLIIRTGPAEKLRGEDVPPVERLAIERAVLSNDGIVLTVLNDGPDPVTIAQVTVDDAYWDFTSDSGAGPEAPREDPAHHPVSLGGRRSASRQGDDLDGHDVRARDRRGGADAAARWRSSCWRSR